MNVLQWRIHGVCRVCGRIPYWLDWMHFCNLNFCPIIWNWIFGHAWQRECKNKQENHDIAKMTARCAQYVSALKTVGLCKRKISRRLRKNLHITVEYFPSVLNVFLCFCLSVSDIPRLSISHICRNSDKRPTFVIHCNFNMPAPICMKFGK